ncbi:MAG: hypothetical protein AABP62_31580 [Planctomycetota bacterium]
MKHITPFLLVGFACFVSCKPERTVEAVSKPAPSPVSTPTASPSVGRFVVLTSGSLVLRMDSTSGETWWLEQTPTVTWVPVKDHLQSTGTYNPATKKIEWGTKLPDGRDLRELSKEELIRWVEAIIKSSASKDPKDPLGLFTDDQPAAKRK